MPYIEPCDREKWSEEEISELVSKITTHGELNYIISRIVAKFLLSNGINYANMNHISGTLDCVKSEFQRRVMGPYEDNKIVKNGDIDEYEEIAKTLL